MTEIEIEEQADKYATEKVTDIRTGKNSYDTLQRWCDRASGFVDGAKWGIEHAIEWHDLRKNPDDLPKEDCETVTLHENGNKNIIKWKRGEWTNAIVIPVIAWCELPTYKE